MVVRPFNVGRVVVLTDPPARGFRAAAAGTQRATKGPAAGSVAMAAEGLGIMWWGCMKTSRALEVWTTFSLW